MASSFVGCWPEARGAYAGEGKGQTTRFNTRSSRRKPGPIGHARCGRGLAKATGSAWVPAFAGMSGGGSGRRDAVHGGRRGGGGGAVAAGVLGGVEGRVGA